MRILGVRCSNKEYAAAILEGTKAAPVLLETKTVAYPKGYTKPQSLRWLVQEMDALLAKHSIEKVVIKAFEGMTRGKSFEDRVEHEAAVIIAAANSGIMKSVFKKVRQTQSTTRRSEFSGGTALIVHPPEEGQWAPGYYSVLFEDPDGIRLEANFLPGKGLLEKEG